MATQIDPLLDSILAICEQMKRKTDMQSVSAPSTPKDQAIAPFSLKHELSDFWSCCRSINADFQQPTVEQTRIAELLVKWVNDVSVPGIDGRKGFFIFGNPGCGKSLLMHGLQRYINMQAKPLDDYDLLSNSKWRMSIVNATTMSLDYSTGGQTELAKYFKTGRGLVIDEIGREPIPSSYFGGKLNVMQYVIELRYNMRADGVTHATSNFDLRQIERLYGDYIADRYKELFNCVRMQGSSLRKISQR